MGTSHAKRWFKLFIWSLIVILLYVVFSIAVLFLSESLPNKHTISDNLSDYGTIDGNRDNQSASQIINSFFPNVLLEEYYNIDYHYHAVNKSRYAFEVYLEFTMDSEVIVDYVHSIADESQWQEFYYNDDYLELDISNGYEIFCYDETYQIEWAEQKKVLYSPKYDKIIFWALCTGSDAFVPTDDFSYFFDKFNIAPSQYAKNALTQLDFYTSKK